MEPYTRNGSIIGKVMDFGATDQYVIGETTGPATIELVATTGRVSSQPASSTLTLPSGLEPGDLVIVATASDGGVPSYPSGYTSGQQLSSSVDGMWAYKFMSDPVDTVVSGLDSSTTDTHIAIAFRGVDQSNPLDVSSPSLNTGGSGSPNPPAITTSTNGAVVVALGFLDDDQIASSLGPPSGYTFAAASDSSSRGATMMSAYKTVTTAGTEDPGTFNTSSDDWGAATLALRPGTAPIPIYGNKKNSGIWDLQSVLEYRSQAI